MSYNDSEAEDLGYVDSQYFSSGADCGEDGCHYCSRLRHLKVNLRILSKYFAGSKQYVRLTLYWELAIPEKYSTIKKSKSPRFSVGCWNMTPCWRFVCVAIRWHTRWFARVAGQIWQEKEVAEHCADSGWRVHLSGKNRESSLRSIIFLPLSFSFVCIPRPKPGLSRWAKTLQTTHM